MKIEIEKSEDEYRLEIKCNDKSEICYIKDIRKLFEYTLSNMMYGLEGKSEYLDRDYAKVMIEYEKEE